ncbi:MAG: hypothetical protein IVW55_10855 [Chloroflexi bacterium]|nr:hypothetical protein [Chloroflexota bacterium]
MEQEARITQDTIQIAHEQRRDKRHEPLYGLAPEAGGGGPGSDHDPSQPSVETPVEEPAEAGDTRLNMTWGIVLGGVLLLFLVAAVLMASIGNTYSSSPLSAYPLK